MEERFLILSAIIFIAVCKGTDGHTEPCQEHQFRCFEGKCIQRTWFCDRDFDCSDHSDEKFCDIDIRITSCPFEDKQWFLCGNNRTCIPSQWVCDGQTDCEGDSLDESRCDAGVESSGDVDAGVESSGEAEYETELVLTVSSANIRDVPFPIHTPTEQMIAVSQREGTAIDSFPEVNSTIGILLEKFLRTRTNSRSTNKWGPQLLRTTLALYFTDSRFFASWNVTGDEIAYELSLQMMSKLALKKNVSTQELALFINALTASCINPKQFFGVDLVAELRNRIDSDKYTNPFSVLSLCNADSNMTPTDVSKINSTFHARLRTLWADTQAFATMAMACMMYRSNLNVDERILTDMVEELKSNLHANGTSDNLRTTAIVLQALIATDSYRDINLEGAVTFLVQQANLANLSILDMYYILPVLNTKSLVNVSSDHCTLPVVTELEMLKKLQKLQGESVQVRASVYFGNEIDVVRTWQLKVPANYTFYQVLERISSLEPAYRVHYSVSVENKPHVVGLVKHFDNAEDGMYWFIYTKNLKDSSQPQLLAQSPVDIQVKEDEELILWYRSEAWLDPL